MKTMEDNDVKKLNESMKKLEVNSKISDNVNYKNINFFICLFY